MVMDNGRGTGDFGAIRRVAMVSVHTSPLATLGEKDAGGLNVYVRELSRQLGRRGIAVDVFTRRNAADLPDVVVAGQNVRVIHVTAGPPAPMDKDAIFDVLPEFASEAALFAAREGLHYDIVHAHYWLSGWAALLLRRHWSAPIVQMFHTLAHLKQGAAQAAGATDGTETARRIETERRVMDGVDAIVAGNARERAEMTWWYGIQSPKICAIPCGIDLDLFRPLDRAGSRVRLGLGPEPILLFVGRIDPAKGVDFLIDGYADLRARWQGAERPSLVLIGGELRQGPSGPELGADLTWVRGLAEARGVADGLILRGPQPHDCLPDYYAAADLTVVPSRYESFGLVAVESMACGTPVVATRVGGLPYTVEDGQNGYLAPYGDAESLGDALERVLRDDALRMRLGAGALDTAREFGWGGVTDRVLGLYNRLLAQRRTPEHEPAAVCAGG